LPAINGLGIEKDPSGVSLEASPSPKKEK